MRARILARWDAVSSSYWFIPSLMSLGAIVLSFVTTGIDGRIGPNWIEAIDALYGNRPDGARALLSTIAGSMIGVAGVTFSITIASVVYASGQYGPRLLTNFMQDRGNQVTLGTFIATFLYGLLVLRTIRSADEPLGDVAASELTAAFVPHVAILTGVVLALASVAVLIFFIHHIPESIHVSNVIAGIGKNLVDRVDTLFPQRLGDGHHAAGEREGQGLQGLPESFFDEAVALRSERPGYVQGVDDDALMKLAEERDLVLRIRHRPGDFVATGDVLAMAWPPQRTDDDVAKTTRLAFAFGRHRSSLQDVRFLVDELVEIAARALSPGVNDPFTAISCLDWLSAALKNLADRTYPDPQRHGDDGALRVVTRPTTFAKFADLVYGQLRPYLAADRNAALHALQTLAELAGRTERPDRRDAVRDQADALLEAAEQSLQGPADLEAVRQRHGVVKRLLSGRVNYEEIAARHPEIGGTG